MTYDLTGKTIIVTGANYGIGLSAAIQLARLGANVIMACRSAERGEAALEQARHQSGSSRIELMLVDMASQRSIRQFAAAFLEAHPRLDVLIHNAANFDLSLKTPVLTEDGIETIFATNHVGPFLLTCLLLDRLKASAPARILTVASKGLTAYPFLDIEFDNLNGERKFSPQHAYYHSKLAQIMFNRELARRLEGTGVTVNCVQVGNVAIPDERLGHLPGWMRRLYALKRRMAITPERMAETYIFLAADPAVQSISGACWDENRRQVSPIRSADNQQTWLRLWQVSRQLAGLAEGTEA